MAIMLIEPAVDQLLAYFQANLDAKVASIAGDYVTNPLTLPAIAAWHITEQPYGTDITPSVSVIGIQTHDDNIGDPSGLGTTNPIAIQILDTYQEPDILRRRLYRYVRAVLLCLRDIQQTAGFVGGFVEYIGAFADYRPSVTAADRAHIWQDAVMSVQAVLRERQ